MSSKAKAAFSGNTAGGGNVSMILTPPMPQIAMVWRSEHLNSAVKLVEFVRYVEGMQAQYITPGVHDPIITGEAFFPATSEAVKSLKEAARGVTDVEELLDWLKSRHHLESAEAPSREDVELAIGNCSKILQSQPDNGEYTVEFNNLQSLLTVMISTAGRDRVLKNALESEKKTPSGKAETERKCQHDEHAGCQFVTRSSWRLGLSY